MNSIVVQLYKSSILSLMNRIENRHNKMFHELYPELEVEIFEVIDKGNKFELRCLVMELEDLLERDY